MSNLDKGMLNIDLDDPELSLEIEIAVRQDCDPAWAWDYVPGPADERPSSLLLWLVHGGGASLSTSRGDLSVTRGDFLLMPSAGVAYHGRHNPDQVFDVSWLYFGVPDCPGVLGGVEGLPLRTSLADLPFVERIMARLLVSPGALRCAWLRVLLDEVRRQHAMRVASEATAQMHELGERIQANPGRYRGLGDMRRDYHYSKDHLIRLFRECHGVTPVEFLIRARIESARALLTATSFSIKQIGAQLGYADAYCFSRQFKARTGGSPTQYRESSQAH